MTNTQDLQDKMEDQLHETSIWTSDVDFWIDEMNAYQRILDRIVPRLQRPEKLKSLDHLQNIVLYYKNEILLDLKSKLFHHHGDLKGTYNGDIASHFTQINEMHVQLSEQMVDIEKRLRSYKQEFLDLQSLVKDLESTAIQHIDHIILPTDFSPNAERAVDYALSILGNAVDRITLFYVHSDIELENDGFDSPDREAFQSAKALIHTEIERIEKGFPDLLPKIRTEVRYGEFGTRLAEMLDSVAVDMIVMGTRGAGGSSALFGSITSKTIQAVHTPVLVIPEETPLLPPKRIMFAADLETSSRPAGMDLLRSLAEQYDAEMRVVHVDKEQSSIDSIHERFSATESLESLGLVDQEVHYMLADKVLSGINDYVKEYMVDMVCTITHHQGFLSKLFRPSTTERMVLHSHIPILVLHESEM
ncbi:MAG: universal stress protein [Flavobacteriales bacterium]|nr:universal stress protein [Flavobacteriales bacterium]